MEESLKQAITTMERAMNGSAAVYRGPLSTLISAAHDNDRLIKETHRWSAAVKRLEAERAAEMNPLAQLREAAAPFATHFAPWMESHTDDTVLAVFPAHTLGHLRALRKAIDAATSSPSELGEKWTPVAVGSLPAPNRKVVLEYAKDQGTYDIGTYAPTQLQGWEHHPWEMQGGGRSMFDHFSQWRYL